MNREQLIALALKYNGEYFEIERAIKRNETPSLEEEVKAITILDTDYPEKLFDLKYPPFVLFYEGNLSLLNEVCYGVVGSRKACDYALRATSLLCSNSDKVIVSGLAKGIDATAHEYSKRTIGILGCGINYIYPYENRRLIRKVKKEGLVISEYPDMTKPLNYHFPFRNRIIAALSERVYVMQSAVRSGTMTTVNEALNMGKEVRVLPYDIFADEGIHNNQLIYEGATPIERIEIAI